MKKIAIEKYAEKELSLQLKFMQAFAIAGIDLAVKYNILSGKEIVNAVKREHKLFCK
jgi:Ser/Thr protein kinase RdoA (MazF antagonist)